jgi:hypothetical protein
MAAQQGLERELIQRVIAATQTLTISRKFKCAQSENSALPQPIAAAASYFSNDCRRY